MKFERAPPNEFTQMSIGSLRNISTNSLSSVTILVPSGFFGDLSNRDPGSVMSCFSVQAPGIYI